MVLETRPPGSLPSSLTSEENPSSIESVLERLELRLDELKGVPSQLHPLENLPVLMVAIATRMSKLEAKIEGIRIDEDNISDPPNRGSSFNLSGLVSKQASYNESGRLSSRATDQLSRLRLPSAVPSILKCSAKPMEVRQGNGSTTGSPSRLNELRVSPRRRYGNGAASPKNDATSSFIEHLPQECARVDTSHSLPPGALKHARSDSELSKKLPFEQSSESDVHVFPFLQSEGNWEETPSQASSFWINSMSASHSTAFPNARSRSKHQFERQLTSLGYCIMSPRSPLRLLWDAVIILTTLLVGVVIPLVLSYFLDRTIPSLLSFFVNYFFDAVWLVDIVVNLRTGFFHGGKLCVDQCSIAKHYARRWLIPDVLAMFPVALLNTRDRVYVSACLLKLLRLLQLGSRYAPLRSEYLADIVLSEVLISFALTSHIMACLWRVALSADGFQDMGESVWTKYVSDAYFISMTLTSTGYGDILPSGSISQLYALAIMIIGVMLIALIVSALTHYTQSYFNDESKLKVSEITHFMQRRGVPKELQRQVQNNLRQQLQYKAATARSRDLLLSLSPAMQRQLCLSVLSNTVMDFPLFRHSQQSFVADLAHAHSWEQVLAGDLVADEGHAVQDVTFVIEGLLQAWTPPGYCSGEFDTNISNWALSHSVESSGESFCVELHSGAWFGEACLFDDHRIYTSMIVAASACELAALPSCEYRSIVQKYPGLWRQHLMIEEKIRNGEVNLAGLRFMGQHASRSSGTGRRKRIFDSGRLNKLREEMHLDDASHQEGDVSRESSTFQKLHMSQVIPEDRDMYMCAVRTC